jgi:hypothetical protein
MQIHSVRIDLGKTTFLQDVGSRRRASFAASIHADRPNSKLLTGFSSLNACADCSAAIPRRKAHNATAASCDLASPVIRQTWSTKNNQGRSGVSAWCEPSL